MSWPFAISCRARNAAISSSLNTHSILQVGQIRTTSPTPHHSHFHRFTNPFPFTIVCGVRIALGGGQSLAIFDCSISASTSWRGIKYPSVLIAFGNMPFLIHSRIVSSFFSRKIFVTSLTVKNSGIHPHDMTCQTPMNLDSCSSTASPAPVNRPDVSGTWSCLVREYMDSARIRPVAVSWLSVDWFSD